MRKLYGVSAAFYGDDPRIMTTAVLSGEHKTDIRVERRFDYALDGDDPAPLSAAVLNLLWDVKGAIRKQGTNGSQFPVPVVYGAADNFTAYDLVRDLCVGFLPQTRQNLARFDAISMPQGLEFVEGKGVQFSPKVQSLAQGIIKSSLELLLAGCSHKGREIQLEPRGYSCAEDLSLFNTDAQQRAIIANRIAGAGLVERFDNLLPQVLDGKSELKDELDETVREIARNLAEPYKIQLGRNANVQRFIGAATGPDTSQQGDVRNRIFPILDLRSVYGEAYMKELGMEHNVCIKCSVDPRSPPFADVAATLMGDHMDKRDRTEPGVVLIQN